MDSILTLPLLSDRKLKADYRYLRERNVKEIFIGYCVDTLKLAGAPLSLQNLEAVIRTAPVEKHTPEWIETSYCWKCICDTEKRLIEGRESLRLYFERIFNFWTREFTLFMQDPILKGEWQKAYADCLAFTEMLAAGLGGKA